MDLPILLGSSYEDNSDVRLDLAAAPHLLVAGTTGSGKSVFLNSLLCDVLEFSDAYLMLIDPKRVEFFPYKSVTPVYVEVEDAIDAIRWQAGKLDERFKLLERHEVRDIEQYNRERPADDRLRRVVVVVDELANLMLSAKARVEVPLTRIAQMGRAAGIHLVLATQRPTVDVVTGLLKANIPGRVAFNVITDTDSRVILDETGAEDLIHPGQMLVRIPGSRGLRLFQGRHTTLEDVEAVVNRYKEVRDMTEYTGETVDLTPSWAGITPALLALVTDGETIEARETAVFELKRMASLADRYVEAVKRAGGVIPLDALLQTLPVVE